MGKSKEERLNQNMNAWLDGLATRGVDTTFPMPALGPLFSFVTSGFGLRDPSKIVDGATKNHEAHDMTVVTRRHYNDTKKYPLLRGSIESILGKFPGLRTQFEDQLDAYETPDDIKNVPVKSMVGGEVLYTGTWNKNSGESIMIGGNDGRMYSYAHLARGSYKVKEGQRVERGQDIALLDEKTGKASGKCIHVVNRLLPFAGREGEEPDFKRWSFLHKDDKGFVPASVFAKALKDFRAEHGGTITYEDLPKKPGTFLFNDNPQVGEAQRPALSEDVHAKPKSKPKVAHKKADEMKEKGWFEWANDKLCDVSGGYIGSCAVVPAKAASKPAARKPVPAKEKPKEESSWLASKVEDVLDWFNPSAATATPAKPQPKHR